MVIIPLLNLHIHWVAWRKGVVSLLPAQSVVETTKVFVMRASMLVSSMVKHDISFENVQRIRREMVMGAIDPSHN